jgi:hypothetical protein
MCAWRWNVLNGRHAAQAALSSATATTVDRSTVCQDRSPRCNRDSGQVTLNEWVRYARVPCELIGARSSQTCLSAMDTVIRYYRADDHRQAR